jgi:hypothetical protein
MSTNLFRDLWTRLFLRGVHYADRHGQLEALYRIEDPWSMDSETEQARFRATNELIVREFGNVGKLLELGSGEGHQSLWLKQICQQLHGREISARAVPRARARCPDAFFSVGDLKVPFADGPMPPFDLVVACEVLYYLSDLDDAIDRLCSLGGACLVTYFETQRARIDRDVRFPTTARRDEIRLDGQTWYVVWWWNISAPSLAGRSG